MDIPGLKDGLIDLSLCRLLLVMRVAGEKWFGSIAQHKESGQTFWVVRINDSKWAGILKDKTPEEFTKELENMFHVGAEVEGKKKITIECSYPPENANESEMREWMLELDLIHPPRQQK